MIRRRTGERCLMVSAVPTPPNAAVLSGSTEIAFPGSGRGLASARPEAIPLEEAEV